MTMNTSHDTPLMHAVLDGEATPEEQEALSLQLADNPAARVAFDDLKKLFGRLAALPPQYPPEGMVAALDAGIGPYVNIHAAPHDQLFDRPRVFGSDAPETRDEIFTAPHAESIVPSSRFYFGKNAMSQTNSLFANRKVLVGGGIAIAAAAIALTFGLGTAPSSSDVTGTIVPAERYRAPQIAGADIPLGDQSISQLLQNDAFLKMVKDPQVQALMLEPDFAASAKLMLDNPDAAKKALAGMPDAQTNAAAHAMLAHRDAALMLLANPDVNRAMLAHQDAALAFVPGAEKLTTADRAAVNQKTDANLISNANQRTDANLTNANQRTDANLTNANQRSEANLTNANQRTDANLTNANQRTDANLTNANQRTDANLTNANQRTDANLTNANQRSEANLTNANQRTDANLTNANQRTDANLTNANQRTDANLTNANQRSDANLTNANQRSDANRNTTMNRSQDMDRTQDMNRANSNN